MMKFTYPIKGLSVLLLALCSAINAGHVAANDKPAGQIVLLIGKATVISSDEKTRALQRGADFYEGDTFETEKKSFVKLKYSDGGLMLLRPSTRLTVEKFTNPESGVGKSVFNLVKGGLRAVTGAVAKKDPSSFKLKTPVATLGVRGTDYTVRYCNGDCEDLEEYGVPAPKDGLYTGVDVGSICLLNGPGKKCYVVGQYGYVASSNTSPELLDEAPGILKGDSLPDPLASNDNDFIAGNACK